MRERIFCEATETETVSGRYEDTSGVMSTSAIIRHSEFDIFYDIVTAEFQKKKNKGNLIFNPMSRFTMTFEQSTCPYVEYTGKRLGVDVEGGCVYTNPLVMPNYSGISSVLINSVLSEKYSSVKNAAVAKAAANIDQSEWLIGASVGELPETVAWLATLVKRFIKLLKKCLNAKAKSIARHLAILKRGATRANARAYAAEISDLWLEFRYAVRPLIFEAAQAAAAFAKSIETGERFTARGFENQLDVLTNDLIHYHQYDGWNTLTWSVVETHSYKARAGYMYTISPDMLERDWTVILGLDKPISVIWELTPFSFIIDWFLNIGDIISAWEKNPSLVVNGSWVSEEYSLTSVCNLADALLDSSWTYPYTNMEATVTEPGTAKSVQRWQSRSVDVTRPIFPSWKINLDTAKLLDLTAIARGLFSSSGIPVVARRN